MNKSINYKEPSEQQLEAMQEFANICSTLLTILLKWEHNLALQNCTTKVNEAMMWFHAYILNGGALKAELPAEPQPEVSPTMAASRIVTLN